MARITVEWKQAEQQIPGIRSLWKAIKAETGTRVRSPKSVCVTDNPERFFPDDSSCCRRYAVDLSTMTLVGSVHVSAGDWACHAGDNHDQSVEGVPATHALATCEWNDYYRFFSLTLQVAKGAIPSQLAA